MGGNDFLHGQVSDEMAINLKSSSIKFGIVSHILPPSPSGQAMVLYRLLNGLAPDRYCLISREGYERNACNNFRSLRLSAKYYNIKPVFQVPIGNFWKLSTLCMAINALLGIFNRAKQIERIVRIEQCELLIACTGDLYDLPAAYLASKWTGIPLIPYIFDDYAYQWTGFNRSISTRVEPIILKHAKTVIVPNEYMQEEYMRRYGIYSSVVHNLCPVPNLEELDKADRVFENDRINIVYTGAIYHAHYDAFHNLLIAIQRLNRSDVKLHLYTDQPESELKQNGIFGAMVVYHSHISESEVPKVLRQADILFLPLAFNSEIPEVIKTSAPGKTGEYLSVGRPILVHAPEDTFVSWFFKQNNCGVVVDKNDTRLLSEEVNKLILNRKLQMRLSTNARKVAETDFSVDKMKSRFLKLINSL